VAVTRIQVTDFACARLVVIEPLVGNTTGTDEPSEKLTDTFPLPNQSPPGRSHSTKRSTACALDQSTCHQLPDGQPFVAQSLDPSVMPSAALLGPYAELYELIAV
jgi:hypothetical protein